MLEFYADRFARVTAMFASLQAYLFQSEKALQAIGEQKGKPFQGYFHEGKAVTEDLQIIDTQLSELGLSMTLRSWRRVSDALKPGGAAPDFAHLREVLREFEGRFCDELEGRVFLSLTDHEAEWYREDKRPLFGPDVAEKFPSLKYEAAEAAKCLALNRSTAAVFHLIRSLEAGIRAMSRCLGIPDPTRGNDRSWASMLKKIKDAMDHRWPHASHRMSGDGKEFEALYAPLAGMQNPYRNATMHLDEKFTMEEAKHILELVRGFLWRVAARIDEDGLPLA